MPLFARAGNATVCPSRQSHCYQRRQSCLKEKAKPQFDIPEYISDYLPAQAKRLFTREGKVTVYQKRQSHCLLEKAKTLFDIPE